MLRRHVIRRRSARQAGFSLIELLVTMTILVLAMVAVLGLFDSTNHLSMVQSDLADLQQSLRITQQEVVRLARMTGRGGIASAPDLNQSALPLAQVRAIHQAPAFEVRNNVVLANQRIDLGATVGTPVLAALGTDILTLRGVFSTPLLWVDFAPPSTATLSIDSFDPLARVIRINNATSVTGEPQDFSAILAAPVGEALLMVSALNPDNFAVGRLLSATQAGDLLTITYENGLVVGDSAASVLMARLSTGGSFPTLQSISSVGILEEWRYFVKEATDKAGLSNPVLTKARMIPGTELPHNLNVANLDIEIASDVHDFQVALGFDSCFPGSCSGNAAAGFLYFDMDTDNIGPDDVMLDNGTAADDWLFNFANAPNGENAGNAPWSPPATRIWDAQTRFPAMPPVGGWNPRPKIKVLRITTLALAPRADRTEYQGPEITAIEDHNYLATDFVNTFVGRRHRRQILQTIVDLRNAQ
jgi:prepilin-type N-terminal cleavage/methylation domain-containing protein